MDTITHRGWRIDSIDPPIPVRDFDWCGSHPDNDGDPEGCTTQVFGRTLDACKAAVDEWIEDEEAA